MDNLEHTVQVYANEEQQERILEWLDRQSLRVAESCTLLFEQFYEWESAQVTVTHNYSYSIDDSSLLRVQFEQLRTAQLFSIAFSELLA